MRAVLSCEDLIGNNDFNRSLERIMGCDFISGCPNFKEKLHFCQFSILFFLFYGSFKPTQKKILIWIMGTATSEGVMHVSRKFWGAYAPLPPPPNTPLNVTPEPHD